MQTTASSQLYSRAQKVIPGGVNSPVRACRSVGADPLFIDRAEGSYIYDADGNRYIDYIGSWGPMILGHRHPAVVDAITRVLEKGTSFGAPTEMEIELAELLIEAVPSVDMVRMVNSGTEAAMSAIRLSRGFTGRDKVVKFDGCYHGHADTLLIAAGSGVATLGIPGSPGVPEAIVRHTVSLTFNDSDGFRAFMAEQGDQVACVIVEPVAGNMGMVTPLAGFLETLQEETQKHGTLLIFDEVMTGFRVAHGGAQALYGIEPDLSCFGKIIGGGMPVGAYGGRGDVMAKIAPQGDVYQAGTLSGNPVAMAAGIATMNEIKKPGFYEALDEKSERLAAGLAAAAEKAGVPHRAGHIGSMLGMFFVDGDIHNFDEAKKCDLDFFADFYKGMRGQGVYIAPSQFEALFLSSAHSDEDIDATIAAAETVLGDLRP
jgi:glutamate-1-semialdehyde 2,1-aminomutase